MTNIFIGLDNSIPFVGNGKGKETCWGVDSKGHKDIEPQILTLPNQLLSLCLFM